SRASALAAYAAPPLRSSVLPATAPAMISTLSLHDALPIYTPDIKHYGEIHAGLEWQRVRVIYARSFGGQIRPGGKEAIRIGLRRSEEHTSELQSRENLVCRLLLEKTHDVGCCATAARDINT